MIELKPITNAGFSEFLERSIQGFADECVAVGRWQAEVAYGHAKKQIEGDLPQGLGTPDHHLFNLFDTKRETEVGYVWIEIMSKDNLPTVFINDIEINYNERRQGHATSAFKLVEAFAVKKNISRVALHVFKANTAAQALYHKLGFQVTGLNMLKNLAIEKKGS